jgi:hypothetical protein
VAIALQLPVLHNLTKTITTKNSSKDHNYCPELFPAKADNNPVSLNLNKLTQLLTFDGPVNPRSDNLSAEGPNRVDPDSTSASTHLYCLIQIIKEHKTPVSRSTQRARIIHP